MQRGVQVQVPVQVPVPGTVLDLEPGGQVQIVCGINRTVQDMSKCCVEHVPEILKPIRQKEGYYKLQVLVLVPVAISRGPVFPATCTSKPNTKLDIKH